MSDVLTTVLQATKPEQLFGTKGEEAAARAYKRLTRQVHPDKFEPKHRDRATQAMANLTKLYAALKKPQGPAGFTLTTKRGTTVVGELIEKGPIANVYKSTSEGRLTITKIVRNPGNSDLLLREAKALKKINAEIDSQFNPYFPVLVDTMKHKDSASGAVRRVVVMDRLMEELTPLSDVLKAFPNGLDPRDASWMFRRLLLGLGAQHRAGVVHGGIVPPNLLLHLEFHGLVLTEYTSSVLIGEDEKVPALARGWEGVYPSEVVSVKTTPTAATDIYMAAKMMELMCGDQAPRQIRAFLKACTVKDQDKRPDDAWQLLEDFTALIERLYGPRRFRVFRMPATA